MGKLIKHMTPREIECGMCGEIDNHDHPDDRMAVPILNGDPTASDGECDGYKAVCAKCYNRWDAWDERMKRSNAIGQRGAASGASDAPTGCASNGDTEEE